MTKIVAVRLHGRGKLQYFDPQDLQLDKGSAVVVETEQGLEYGFCSGAVSEPTPEFLGDRVLRPVLRLATREDTACYENNLWAEQEAFRLCQAEIERHNLPMELVESEYVLDKSRLIFYFTVEGRVDFRELVKDLAAIFRTRIELRQIGVRDEAALMGGLGICGRALCCCTFLQDFHPVSIRMAKEQNLSMNPAKISGNCGRLLCCLRYEEEAYIDANKRLPSKGEMVETKAGRGVVQSVNLLRELITVRLDNDEAELLILPADEVRVLKSPKKGKKH